jgi:transcriptional regulator with XRE-family HTH domain
VPDHGSPTVRRRRLAAELRRLRERAGFTGDEVAERLGWSGSKISRIELHRIGIKRADLLSLLELYEVADTHRERLLALDRESRKPGRLEAVAATFPGEQAAFLYAEAEAQSVWAWDPQVVPGLLQTADYARAVMLCWHEMFDAPPGEADRRVEARLLRQEMLDRDPPLTLAVVIDESVLYRRLGSPAIMRDQLMHIAEASERHNVTVQVIPLAGDQLITTGAFTYMQFPQVHDVPLHDIAVVEHLTGSDYIEDEEDTYRYHKAFSTLTSRTLTSEESLQLVRNAIAKLDASH